MKLNVFLLLAPGLLFAFQTIAQPGCPDPQATNFNPSATSNDGSCLYPLTNYGPQFKAILPATMQEISGHVKAGNFWYCHNDGSDSARFYRFNPENGLVNQEVQLENASNTDWEDVAATTTHLYIGDLGNNTNDRQNLGIYKVPLAAIGSNNPEVISDDGWVFIPFSYEDQTDFSTQPIDSAVFDCEAMIFFNGKLHLFTKNRKEYTTSHYIVNEVTGKAEKIETFDTDGLITGADISPDGEVVTLLGYDLRGLPKVFAWLLWDWKAGSDSLFSGNKRRIELGSALVAGQAEGIGFAGNRTGYLTNERTSAGGVVLVEPGVRSFDFGQWVPESIATDEILEAARFQIFPNPFFQTVQFQFFDNKKPVALRMLDSVGKVILNLDYAPEKLDIGHLPPGIYTFEITWRGGGTTVVRGMKN